MYPCGNQVFCPCLNSLPFQTNYNHKTFYAFVHYCFSIYLNVILSTMFGVPNVLLRPTFSKHNVYGFLAVRYNSDYLSFFILSPNVSRLLCKLWSFTMHNCPVNLSFTSTSSTQHCIQFLDVHQKGVLK